ncbi:mechanosensitive ion channel protein MscS [Methanoculleus taiwanensis]|uniref:Mechanosensitive ion channel protein MscS n=1 Tax=Methanoculleus taiwanensis TaxID=1550565 RepID=A0A498H229_9EURY|nr:mechanosensitive ion channel domain-containing protein [Methanoculleus taiwanensis]RXE55956.1 mechanosensitive ion channel protein MscS [Methanoculleus taiwanensis]
MDDDARKQRNEFFRDTVRVLISLALLAGITVSFWLADQIFPDISLEKLYLTFLAVTIIYLIFTVIRWIALRQIREKKTRYSFKRTVSVLYYIIIIAVTVRIWIDTNYIFVAYGIIGAGIAIALQDLFKNFVGGILIFVSRIYTVGDRIELEETMGDVIDIGILNTTLLEIHERGVQGDQPTGRITTVPNGAILSSKSFNFTKDHSFIWDEISIPITYDTDWRRATELFLAIVTKETEEITLQAEREIARIGEKYYFPKKVVEPSIYLTLTDNWITFDIRYVTEVRTRRILKDELSRKLLEAVEESGYIAIATENIIVYEGGPFEGAS